MRQSKKANAEAALSAELYRNYNSERAQWAEEASIDQDYYFNKQWTEAEKTILSQRGQAALVINRIFPVIQQKLAQLGAHRPVIRALPVGESDTPKSHLWSMLIEYVLQNSNFALVDLEVKRNHLVQGVGYYYVFVDEDPDDGKGEVCVQSLPPEVVYVDPNSRKPDYSDADHILVSNVYTIAQAKRMFPFKASLIESAADEMDHIQDYTSTDFYTGDGVIRPGDYDFRPPDEQRKVRVIERYTKEQTPFWVVVGPEMHEVVDKERYEALYKDHPNFQSEKVMRPRVRRVITLGETVLISDVVLPIEDYPVVPVPCVWTGTPYPIGEVRYMRGIQDEINKRRSLVIYHATSSTGPKWLAEKGSIDEREWMERGPIPHAVLTWRPGYTKPEYVFPPQIPNGILALEHEAKHDLQSVSGVFNVSQGDPVGAPNTYGATLALEEYANRRSQPSAEMFSSSKRQLGRVIIGLSRYTYTIQKFMRIIGEEGDIQEFLINADENSRITTKDERYDVVVESGRFAPTNRIAYAQFMRERYRDGVIENETLIDSLDLPNKQKIKERNGMLHRQAGVIKAQDAEIKELNGTLQTFRRELEQLMVKSKVDQFANLEQAQLRDVKLEAERAKMKLQLAVDGAQTRLKNLEQMRRTASARPSADETESEKE